MRILVVKLSSLGDIVHTFPAVTDAVRRISGLRVDWAVEEAFVPLVRLHPAVDRIIAVPLRRLRKAPRQTWRDGVFSRLRQSLSQTTYDAVIDAQGLLKSALVARFAQGRRHGFDRASAREGWASLFYDRTYAIPETEHMAARIRKLFAAALDYDCEDLPIDGGLGVTPASGARPYLMLLHGTTWTTKTWTVQHWRDLALLAGREGLTCRLFAQGEAETVRARAIAEGLDGIDIVPPGSLDQIVPILAGAVGAVSVDSGLGHLAAVLGLPTLGLYGPTDARLTGLYGARVMDLASTRPCAPCEKARCRLAPQTLEGPPCLRDLRPQEVWRAFERLRFGRSRAH